MSKIEQFVNDFVSSHSLEPIYVFNLTGFYLPYTLWIMGGVFIILATLFSRGETDEDQVKINQMDMSINPDTISPGVFFAAIATYGILYGLGNYVIQPLNDRFDHSFIQDIDSEMDSLKDSEDRSDNIDFVKSIKWMYSKNTTNNFALSMVNKRYYGDEFKSIDKKYVGSKFNRKDIADYMKSKDITVADLN